MDKIQMVNELFWLLENNGETGCERIFSHKKVRLPFLVCIKNNLVANKDESLIYDVFRSDTPSRIAVNNKTGVTVDWMDLDTDTCNKIFNIVKKVRSDEYNKLVQVLENLQEVRACLESDKGDMDKDDGCNRTKLDKAIQMINELMKID